MTAPLPYEKVAYPAAPWQMVGSLWLSLFRSSRTSMSCVRPGSTARRSSRTRRAAAHLFRAARRPAIRSGEHGWRVRPTSGSDSPCSVAGGREMWAIPKGLCDFTLESSYHGPITTTEWSATSTAGRSRAPGSPTFPGSRRGCRSRAAPAARAPQGPRREDRHPAGLIEGRTVSGPLELRPRRPAGLAAMRPAACVVPPGGLPDVVRLIRPGLATRVRFPPEARSVAGTRIAACIQSFRSRSTTTAPPFPGLVDQSRRHHEPRADVVGLVARIRGDARPGRLLAHHAEPAAPRECVLNLAPSSLVDHVDRLALLTGTPELSEHKRATGYRDEPRKFEAASLTPQQSDLVRPDRVLECPIQRQCELTATSDRHGIDFGASDPRHRAARACRDPYGCSARTTSTLWPGTR